jgi:NTP pyrophosphatase (non-canonical NTP hydrolase)
MAEPLTLPQLQARVDAFVARHGLDALPSHRLLRLTARVGALAQETLRTTHAGREPFRATHGFAEELGDAFLALTCLANATGVRLDDALERALRRHERRLAARDEHP